MILRSALGKVRARILSDLHRRAVPVAGLGPIVSFSFDDFPRTACSRGAAILERYQARGTYYTAMGMMNTSNELGEQFREEDLHQLLERGHEIASHTFSHLSCRKVGLEVFRRDLERGRRALQEVAGADSGSFAYPYGHVTVRAKQTLGPALRSSRGIQPGLNGPAADLNLLRANGIYGGLSQSSRVKRLIAQNAQQPSWLIFYTHDVQPSPSPYGCTPELLDYAVSQALSSGSRILTVEQALTEFETGMRLPVAGEALSDVSAI